MTVLTGPEWLFQMFNNYPNEKGTALLKPTRDADNLPIIGKQVMTDPDWEFIKEVTDPEGNTNPVSYYLEEIPYNPPPPIE